jgi:hypothetical protein
VFLFLPAASTGTSALSLVAYLLRLRRYPVVNQVCCFCLLLLPLRHSAQWRVALFFSLCWCRVLSAIYRCWVLFEGGGGSGAAKNRRTPLYICYIFDLPSYLPSLV